MNMPLVSVIVPIYNVEDYLQTCCNSILSQSFNNIEVILVNDGSTDGSCEIAKQIEKKDSRVILIDQRNGGLSAARNAGLKVAKGDYVLFVDSDDWIEKNCIQELYQDIQRNNSDVSCCLAQYISAMGTIRRGRSSFGINSLTGDEILPNALLVKTFPTSAWGKLYRRDFLHENGLLFKEGIVNEDTLFSIQIACLAKKISFVDKVLFDIWEREGSISRSSFEKLFQDMNIALLSARSFMEEHNCYNEPLDKLYKARYLKSNLYNLLQIAQRLQYPQYCKMYNFCMSSTCYLEYGDFAVFLPRKHRIMYSISKSPFLLFVTMKVLNFFNYRMH